MKNVLTILAFVVTFLYNAKAQTQEHFSVINTVDKGDYFYIPKGALTGPFQGIVYQDKTLRKSTAHKQPIELYWNSTCNDGSFKLTITPEQIFFSSGHENPNPNVLFWVIEINESTYEAIKQGLTHGLPKGFQNLSKYYQGSKIVYFDSFKDNFPIPNNWTETKLLKHKNYCQLQIRNQVDRYLSIVNAYLPLAKSTIAAPKINYSAGRLFSYSKEEVRGWLPVLISR